MTRGKSYRRHQDQKRKVYKRKFYRSIWPRTADYDDNPEAPHIGKYRKKAYEKRGPVISDRFVGIVSKTNGHDNAPRCRCSWCKPGYNRRLQKNIDSQGELSDHQPIHGDKWHGC